MSNIISNYFSQLILVLLLALATFLGAQVKGLYKKYVTTEIKKSVCKTAVRFVEQVFKDLHGRDKLRQAMKKASEILATYNITITDDELVAMLEAAVNEFNNSFVKTDPEVKAKNEMEKSFFPPLPDL